MMENADSSNEQQVLATFEIKVRPDADMEEALKLQENLFEVARSTSSIGEIESSSWVNEEGSILTLYKFKSLNAMREFVRHPDHQAAMKRANEFFTSIKTQIAQIQKQSETSLS